MATALSNELGYAMPALDAHDRGGDAKAADRSDAVGTRLGNATVIGAAGHANARAWGAREFPRAAPRR